MRIIKNNKKFRQRLYWGDLDFNGLSFTDIDAFMNYFEKFLIFIESKEINKDLGYAQKKAFETIIDNLKIDSIYIIVWHNLEDCEKNILLKNCFVYKYYYKKKWFDGKMQNFEKFILKVLKKIGE